MPFPEARLAVLMFTDIVNSTGLKHDRGVAAYLAAFERHNALFEGIARCIPGMQILKHTGDGYLASFTGVAEAVRFALLFQHAMRREPWTDVALLTRVGIHTGEVTETQILGRADVQGPAADLSARVMSLAVGGQILLTRAPFDEARPFVREHPPVEGEAAPALRWLAHGPYLLKGRDEPMEIFEVGAESLAPLAPPPDSEKAKRAIRAGEEETLGWRPADGLEIPGRPGWRLVGKLGAGGFGEVWAGEQVKTRERRAFKFCFDAERLRALKREVTLTRLLRETLGERDDIVRIHDLRLDQPPYFLESELATDGNLLQWAEKQGGLAAIPLETRLEIVAATATALAAAHSVSVLHKDIKPTNVLIFTDSDGHPHPRLVDFGIGTLSDPAVLVQHGITGGGFTQLTLKHSSGTPTYSPPEYIAGRPFTVQGDIFALGVMLYQLVTADSARPIGEGWQRDVKDDLLREDIALCVDGDPARRFPSATALADRLRSLPERAREATRRAAAEVRELQRHRRQRTLILSTAAAVLIAAIALPLALWALREARTRFIAQQLAQARLVQAENARDAAENLVSNAIFGLHDKLAPLGKVAILEDMAVAAENYYARLPPELSSDITRRHQVWLALNRAIVASARSDDRATEVAAQRAFSLAGELATRHPENTRHIEDQANALMLLCILRRQQGRHEEASGYADQLLKTAMRWLEREPDSPLALRGKLVAHVFRLASTGDTGYSLLLMMPDVVQCQELTKRLKDLGDESQETQIAEGVSMIAQATIMAKMHNGKMARAEFSKADAILKSALESGYHAGLDEFMLTARRLGAMTLIELARKEGNKDWGREAYGQFKEVAGAWEKLAEFEPARLERWKQLAWACHAVAGKATEQEGANSALAWAEKGLTAAERAISLSSEQVSAREARIFLRIEIVRALRVVRPLEWQTRALKLIAEGFSILTDSTVKVHYSPSVPANFMMQRDWREIVMEFDTPERAAESLREFRPIMDTAQRLIDATPDAPNARKTAVESANAIATFLRSRRPSEAAEFGGLANRWSVELKTLFP